MAEGRSLIDDLFLVFLFSVLEMKGGFKWSFELSFPNKGLPFPPTVGYFIRILKGMGEGRPGE